MENSRRPFDRSREPGPKKARLIEELDRAPNSGARQFPQLQVISGVATLPSARFRTNERDLESNDFGRRGGAGGGGYQPQPLPFQELVTQYKAALAELTFNSKPIITNLTIIAGENQAAEKAIAATVCANILEVPSDQKLPSLYLLDSIVKNIGRDYIKYFAARLPEVFCKAYRQVDPSVHQSMRHLFGTWKGVFPPQTLQIIEKELGFTSAVNGSSASATLRSDSQSQRPPHSIHVNPKYLERQRLQQSSRTKGVVDDMTGAISNSNDDLEMPGRTLGVLRPWVDPNVTVNNDRARRDAFNDSVPEKSTGASYGSNEFGSNISRNLGLGISRPGGRVTESGHDKGWYNKSGVVAGTMPGQRNGLSLKYSFLNTEAPKSMILDTHHQPAQKITSTQSSVISNSWKNSEEEEYTWDEMNSGLTGHGTSIVSSLSKDAWTADDDNLEVEDRNQVRNPFVVNANREIAIESQANEKKRFPASQHHSSISWKLQEQHSIDELDRKAGQLSRFVSTPSSTSASTARMGNRPFLSNASIGLPGVAGPFHSLGDENPSGQSPLRRRSPSPPGPFSSMTFQARHQQQFGTSHNEVTIKTEKPPVSKVSLARETKSSTSTGNLPTRLGVRPSRTGGPSPATLISSVSTIALPSSLGPSSDNSPALSKIPQRKVGQPPRLSTLPPASSNVSSASAQTSDAISDGLNHKRKATSKPSSVSSNPWAAVAPKVLREEINEVEVIADHNDHITLDTAGSAPHDFIYSETDAILPGGEQMILDSLDDTVAISADECLKTQGKTTDLPSSHVDTEKMATGSEDSYQDEAVTHYHSMHSDENELSLCRNNVDDSSDCEGSENWLLLPEEDELACTQVIQAIRRDFQEVQDYWDATMVAEYSDDIFKYMAELEESTLPNPRYMDAQTEIEWEMRTTLIDWLLQVHMRYHMLPETLWIAVNIIDRFLSKRVVSLVKFQLVGVTAMFVAAKYEEIMAPSVEEFVYMTENGYTRDEILKGEKILLTTLDFRISSYCSPYSWLRRISKADDYDIQTRTLSKFLMELTLLDHRFLRAKSSMIAAIGMYTARRMLGADWSDSFVFYSGYTEAQLITPMTFLIEFLSTDGFEDRFVYKKYANRKFLKASIFARNQALKRVREESPNQEV